MYKIDRRGGGLGGPKIVLLEYTNSDNFMGRALQLGQARGPSAETGKGKGAERRG